MSGIDASAIESIRDLAYAAKRADVTQVVGIPHSVLITRPDGEIQWEEKPPADIDHRVDTVDDLVRAAAEYDPNGKGSLWIEQNKVTLLLDNATRRDLVTCPLAFSQRFLSLCKLGHEKTQTEFVRLLQTELAGVAPDGLLSLVRRIKFHSTTSGHGAISQGEDSFGREVSQACLSDEGEIPDQITCKAPVYITSGFGVDVEQSVLCSLIVDAATATFVLVPKPDQIDAAGKRSLLNLYTNLQAPEAGLKCPVFLGSPFRC